MRILILDDEPAIREIYRESFQKDGHVVHEESNGADGLLTLGQYPFDLVVSDISMPILDGIRFLRITRPRYPLLPIIFVSGGSTYKTTDIMKLGASGVLDKTQMDFEKIQSMAVAWIQTATASKN